MGLQVYGAKCPAHCRSHCESQYVSAASGAMQVLRGLVIVGTPLGEDKIVRETVTGKAEEAHCAGTTLMTLPILAQGKNAVLQGSLKHEVAHFSPVTHMALVGKAVSDTADAAADAALAIEYYEVQPSSDVDPRARAQLELHMREGGTGLHRLFHVEGSAAFLSSAALANVAMIGAPEQFQRFDGPSGVGVRLEWSQLRTHAGHTNLRGEVIDDVYLRTVLPLAQKDTSRATATSRLRSITTLHDGSIPLKRTSQRKARMLVCASWASSIWLTAAHP